MDDEDITFGLTIYNNGQGVVRPVALGLGDPKILIELTNTDGVASINVSAGGDFDTPLEVADVLAYVAAAFDSDEFSNAWETQREALENGV